MATNTVNTIDHDLLNRLTGRDGQNAAVHVADDPVTGVREVSVYTDDGHGNGNLMFVVRLADLLRIASQYNTDRA